MARRTTNTSNQEVVQEEVKTVSSQPVRKARIELDRNLLIPVMNNTTGTLIYISKKTGAEWKMQGYGAVDEMELGELITMKSAHPKFLNQPWLIILDDEVVEYLGLTKLYENVLKPEELDEFFDLPIDEMESIMKKAPMGMKQLIASKAKQMYADGILDSVKKKELIESTFGIDL